MEIEQAYQSGILSEHAETIQTQNITAAELILQTACSTLGNRAEIRDQSNGERSAKKAAAILTAWTGDEWSEGEVWRCLLAVKLARETQGKFHSDDYIDAAGYAALLGESQAK